MLVEQPDLVIHLADSHLLPQVAVLAGKLVLAVPVATEVEGAVQAQYSAKAQVAPEQRTKEIQGSSGQEAQVQVAVEVLAVADFFPQLPLHPVSGVMEFEESPGEQRHFRITAVEAMVPDLPAPRQAAEALGHQQQATPVQPTPEVVGQETSTRHQHQQ